MWIPVRNGQHGSRVTRPRQSIGLVAPFERFRFAAREPSVCPVDPDVADVDQQPPATAAAGAAARAPTGWAATS